MKNKLNLIQLSKGEERNVKGGWEDYTCYCACAYANSGGSSKHDNDHANWAGRKSSPVGEVIIVKE